MDIWSIFSGGTIVLVLLFTRDILDDLDH